MKFSLLLVISWIFLWVTTTQGTSRIRCQLNIITGQEKCRPTPKDHPTVNITLILHLRSRTGHINDLDNVTVDFEYKDRVTVLQLNNNNIKNLSNFPEQFPNTTILDLSNNSIEEIGAELSTMRKLNTVHLQGNPLRSISGKTFRYSKDLEYLDISHTSLTTLEINIFCGTQLKEKNLKRNGTNIKNIDEINFPKDCPAQKWNTTTIPQQTSTPQDVKEGNAGYEEKNAFTIFYSVLGTMAGICVFVFGYLVIFNEKFRKTLTKITKTQNTHTEETETPLNQNTNI